MSNRIEELEVYNLSEIFADKVWTLVLKRDFFANDTLAKQIVRAANSIGANIAEGFGMYHHKENKNSCYYSRGLIIETKVWLKKVKTRDLVDEESNQLLSQMLEHIHLKLNGYIKFIGSRVIKNNDLS